MSLGSVSDLRFMLRDAGEPVVYNGVASFGILNHEDALEGLGDGGMAQTKVITVLVETAAFVNADGDQTLRVDGRITVAGKPYRIDRVAPEDDGATTRCYLARAS